MTDSRKYVITKNEKTDVITYTEFIDPKGFVTKPKRSLKVEDMINVNEMVIINPSFIKTLVHKKCEHSMEKLIKMISSIYTDEDGSDGDDDGTLDAVLDEVKKFSDLLYYKYQEYLKEEEFKAYCKKLKILQSEVMLRKEALFDARLNYFDDERKGR